MFNKSIALASLVAIAAGSAAYAAPGSNAQPSAAVPQTVYDASKATSSSNADTLTGSITGSQVSGAVALSNLYRKSAKCEGPNGMRANGEDGRLDSSWVLIDVSKTKYAVKDANFTEYPVLAYGLIVEMKAKPLPNGHLKIEGVVTCDDLKGDAVGKVYGPGEWPGLNGMVALPVDAEIQIGKPVMLSVGQYHVTIEIDQKP